MLPHKHHHPIHAVKNAFKGIFLRLAGVLWLSGCSNLGYYVQSLNGHMELVNKARPIQDVLDDADTKPAVRERLTQAQAMRQFATDTLKLPDNPSYTKYSDLGRPYVIWNVVAAPELSLQPKTWCFMVTGCISYRGYYQQEKTEALATELQAQGWETTTYGVPAYSTLGKTNWLGGDPILSTFIHYPEGRFAALLFHELAHQVLYVKGDSTFNESFATAVEQIGVQRWLEAQRIKNEKNAQIHTKTDAKTDTESAWQAFQTNNQRRQSFRQLTIQTRKNLHSIYTNPSYNTAQKRIQKAQAMEDFRSKYEQWKQQRNDYDNYSGYDKWVAKANNANFAAMATYDTHVPAFKKMFAASGEDFEAFYAAVKELAKKPKVERDAYLNSLINGFINNSVAD